MDDLFGHVPQRREPDLRSGAGQADEANDHAGDEWLDELLNDPLEVPMGTGNGPPVHTPETIRAFMQQVLAKARAATVMPWSARNLRFHTGTFPLCAEWLKGGEGDRLMAEFKAELDRLEAPAQLLAPNWRKLWGFAANAGTQ